MRPRPLLSSNENPAKRPSPNNSFRPLQFSKCEAASKGLEISAHKSSEALVRRPFSRSSFDSSVASGIVVPPLRKSFRRPMLPVAIVIPGFLVLVVTALVGRSVAALVMTIMAEWEFLEAG